MARFDISDFVADGGYPPRYWYVTMGAALLVGVALDRWFPLRRK